MDGIDPGSLDEEARRILRLNDKGGYTVPTAGLYPYQWNWDSAFAALGFATFDVDRAWAELETLFAGQWDNGMVPHILFHAVDDGYFPGPDVWGTQGAVGRGAQGLPSSGISQPPVAAALAWTVFEMDREAGAARLAALFPKLVAFHRWMMAARAESGAVCITHPWEAGRDNAPDWDEAMAGIDPVGVAPYTRRDTGHVDAKMRPTQADYDRYIWLVQFGRDRDWDDAKIAAESPFRVADPTMTFTCLRSLRDLARMADILGADRAEIDGWIGVLEEGVRSLWNPATQSYEGRNLRTGQFAGSVSNAGFLCWWAGVGDAAVRGTLDTVLDRCRYALPSYDPAGPEFDHLRYWRGPVWAIMNYMAAKGMAEAGLETQAERIRRDTARLIAERGFAEYFSPIDGTPAGGGTFTWTAAVWLAWASPSVKGA
ncbi:MGH1-like glycoside hydrolase domain-containing protein [Gymnodinialimonas ulvae]|uniref:MGH1-like glycoside hydrolase domain-containing protein n=1 Tax=Gymnodinialimonas ulvae TaxID=3126504 RepID=UPI0030B0C32D